MNELIAANLAPMKKDTMVNLDIILFYGEFLKINKVSGAFINGSMDVASMTVGERKRILVAWAANKPEGFHLIIHVGHTSLRMVVQLTSHAADKVDAVATLSLYYIKPPTLQSLVDYCRQIAACAPNLPFYYYHIPVLTGENFSMDDFLELASDQIQNLAGTKFKNNNLRDYSNCKIIGLSAYNFFFGLDEIFLSNLLYGATGWLGNPYNHLAPLYDAIIKDFSSNEHKLASELQTKSMQFVDILNNMGSFSGTARSFMKTMGVDCGPKGYQHKTLSNKKLKKVSEVPESFGVMQH